jgi:hypothetical protein
MIRRQTAGFGLIALVLTAALVAVLAYTVLVTYFKSGSAVLPGGGASVAVPAAGAAGMASPNRPRQSPYVTIVSETAASLQAAEHLREEEIQKILHSE